MKKLTEHTEMPSNSTFTNLNKHLSPLLTTLFLGLITIYATGCASPKVTTFEPKLGKQRATENLLMLPPICQDPKLDDTCTSLGNYMKIEVPKRVSGEVIYADDITSFGGAIDWENLVVNGAINRKEIVAMAAALNCKSALTCQLIEVKPYPPFRAVVLLYWIDVRTSNVIAKLYNDVDLSETDTDGKYSSYAGEGPLVQLYEKFFYSKGRYRTAVLSPEQFMHFVAAYSAKVVFHDKNSSMWNFWRLF